MPFGVELNTKFTPAFAVLRACFRPIVKACLQISLLIVQANTIISRVVHLPKSQHSTLGNCSQSHYSKPENTCLHLSGLNTNRGHKNLQFGIFHQKKSIVTGTAGAFKVKGLIFLLNCLHFIDKT